MSIDSKDKRFTILGMASPLAWQILPNPDGGFDKLNRSQLLHGYFEAGLDTKAKRFAMLAFASPLAWQIHPDPDGSIDKTDRYHLLHSYLVGPGGSVFDLDVSLSTVAFLETDASGPLDLSIDINAVGTITVVIDLPPLAGRPVSSATWQAITAQETGEVYLVLLTIDHADLSTSLRFVNNTEDILSRGDTFIRFPFEITLPTDMSDEPPTATIRIDNVDRQIVQAIRTITSEPSVTIEVIRAANPDLVEISIPDFKLVNVTYDALVVEGKLGVENFLNEPYPSGIFSPADFPGLF